MSISDCAGELQYPNGRFGDVVALNFIIVALDKEGGLTAIGDIIVTGKIVVTGQIPTRTNGALPGRVPPIQFWVSRNSPGCFPLPRSLDKRIL